MGKDMRTMGKTEITNEVTEKKLKDTTNLISSNANKKEIKVLKKNKDRSNKNKITNDITEQKSKDTNAETSVDFKVLKTKVRNVKNIMKSPDKNEMINEIEEQNSKVTKVNGGGDAKGANPSQFNLNKDRKNSHNMALMPRSLAGTLGTITESSTDGTFLSTKA